MPWDAPFGLPPFEQVRAQHFRTALPQAMAQHRDELAALCAQAGEPTFDNTLVAMEQSGQMLTRALYVFGALTAANTNPALDKIDAETAPKLADMRDQILLNEKLFTRIKSLYDYQKWTLPQKYFAFYTSAELHKIRYRITRTSRIICCDG